MKTTFTEFMKKRYEDRKDKNNQHCVGISDAEFRDFILDYLIGRDLYITDPAQRERINEIALRKILEKYSKEYRKEQRKIKKRRK